MRVSRGYFEMLGVRPALGRSFTEAEDQPGAARRVAILSDRLWRDRFGADPRVVGRPIDVSGIAHQVVGVLPRGFEDLVAARLYAGGRARGFRWDTTRRPRSRAAPAATCASSAGWRRVPASAGAERELGSVFHALEAEHPKEYDGALGAG